MNGRGDEKYGLFRYHRADMWFDKLAKEKNLTPTGIINNVIADAYMPPTITTENFTEYKRIKIYDSICRYSTVAVSVVEGVKKGENPEMTTYWLNLGHSASSVSIPLWLYANEIPAPMYGDDESELNHVFRDLRNVIGCDDYKYISPEKYVEVRQHLDQLQEIIDTKTAAKLKIWQKNLPKKSEVAAFQNEITDMVLEKAKEVYEFVK